MHYVCIHVFVMPPVDSELVYMTLFIMYSSVIMYIAYYMSLILEWKNEGNHISRRYKQETNGTDLPMPGSNSVKLNLCCDQWTEIGRKKAVPGIVPFFGLSLKEIHQVVAKRSQKDQVKINFGTSWEASKRRDKTSLKKKGCRHWKQ